MHMTSGHESGMRRTVVLADDHVLDGLARAGHVHGVGQVGPAQARVVHLLLQHLVRVVAHDAWDVIVLHSHIQLTVSAQC